MNRITSAQLVKNFGKLADDALSAPVTITRNGRDRLVMLSVDEYERLKRRDRQVHRTGELPQELVDAIREAEPPKEAKAYDHEYDPDDR